MPRHGSKGFSPEGAWQGLELVLYGDSIFESWRGTQFGQEIARAKGVPQVWRKHYGKLKAAAFAIAGTSTPLRHWALHRTLLHTHPFLHRTNLHEHPSTQPPVLQMRQQSRCRPPALCRHVCAGTKLCMIPAFASMRWTAVWGKHACADSQLAMGGVGVQGTQR